MLCGKEAVDVYLALGADVDVAVDDGGRGEAESVAGAVARGVLIAAVEGVGYVCGVGCVEDGGLVGVVAASAAHEPDDGVFVAVGRDDGCGEGVFEAKGAGGFEVETTVFELEVAE